MRYLVDLPFSVDKTFTLEQGALLVSQCLALRNDHILLLRYDCGSQEVKEVAASFRLSTSTFRLSTSTFV